MEGMHEKLKNEYLIRFTCTTMLSDISLVKCDILIGIVH